MGGEAIAGDQKDKKLKFVCSYQNITVNNVPSISSVHCRSFVAGHGLPNDDGIFHLINLESGKCASEESLVFNGILMMDDILVLDVPI